MFDMRISIVFRKIIFSGPVDSYQSIIIIVEKTDAVYWQCDAVHLHNSSADIRQQRRLRSAQPHICGKNANGIPYYVLLVLALLF